MTRKNHGGKYGGFQDPAGLVRRMAASRDRAAWSALVRAAAELPAAPLDRVLASRERFLIERAPASTRPLVLVVGAPRSGTTLVYQALVAALPVSYLSNWSALFPRAPISASRLIGCRDQIAPADFHSYYGQTRRLRGVNDGYHVWDRWFGHNRFANDRPPGQAERTEMRRFFDAWSGTMDAPLVNKNNRNSLYVPLLAEILPEAIFVVVRRDPYSVARSLLRARQVVQGSVTRGWGLLSSGTEGGDLLSAADAVCEQVLAADAALAVAEASVPSDRIISVRYEEFACSPASVAAAVGQRLFPDVQPLVAPLAPFHFSNQEPLDPEIAARIRSTLRSQQGDG